MQIKRSLLADLRKHLEKPEMTLIIGPRQAGKTTLLFALESALQAQDKQTLRYNLDIDADAQFFRTQQDFVDRLKLELSNSKAYVFIDEVQRISNARLFLKGLYDRRLPYKFVVTGSGSLELKEKIAESLVGRKRNFYLLTVRIEEYLHYKTDYQYESKLSAMLASDTLLAAKLLLEYMTYGGYPKVVTAETMDEKYSVLTEIFQGYIEKDIRDLLQLTKSDALVKLLQLIANRIGHGINYNNLSTITGLSIPTIKQYLWYAEKTYVIAAVRPFFRNKEKEIIKTPQYYFLDNGLRNYLINNFEISNKPDDTGMLFQQFIFRLLYDKYQHSISSLQYWRTQNQAEVDFIINHGNSLIPVEVKYSKLKKTTVSRSFRSFIQKYKPKEAWIINRSLKETITIDDSKVHFKPWWELLDENII